VLWPIHALGMSLRCERHKELLGLDYCEHASEETQAEDPLRAEALKKVLADQEVLERLLYHSDEDKPGPNDPIWQKAAPPQEMSGVVPSAAGDAKPAGAATVVTAPTR